VSLLPSTEQVFWSLTLLSLYPGLLSNHGPRGRAVACANRRDRCCMSSSSISNVPAVESLTVGRKISSWELLRADYVTVDHDIC